ncbi:GNAT family N-acetyltransferase [Geodermatophilus sp. SYSU D00684]
MRSEGGVRPAGPADADAAADLLVRFFREEGFATPEADVRARVHPFLGEPANHLLVAEDATGLVAVATVTTTFGFEAGRSAELEDLYVLPERRRRGWAAGLVGAAADWCRARGCAELDVVVTPAGQRAHGLAEWYGARGFTRTGREVLTRTL